MSRKPKKKDKLADDWEVRINLIFKSQIEKKGNLLGKKNSLSLVKLSKIFFFENETYPNKHK
jgi:hypothetical protein